MIRRLYAKSLIGFESVELEFEKGLVVISGPSGSGKSVLMQLLLAMTGHADFNASLAEIAFRDLEITDEAYWIEEEPVVRGIKKEKARFFLNDQSIAKERLRALFSERVIHLSQKNSAAFSNAWLLELLDARVTREDAGFLALKEEYLTLYGEYVERMKRLTKLREDEKRIAELIEFAEYEIAKIDEVGPKVGEDEALMQIKRKLSKKEKIAQAVERAQAIFDYESAVHEALNLMERPVELFDEAMNALRGALEEGLEDLNELDAVDVEGVLDRIEMIAALKRRFGSIEEILVYREAKAAELENYRNIDHAMGDLAQFVADAKTRLAEMACILHERRLSAAEAIEAALMHYLEPLRLQAVRFLFQEAPLGEQGTDFVDIRLGEASLRLLSSGEFNRLRLAMMLIWAKLKEQGGLVLIDEIDANVSGDESIAIAKVLKDLAGYYQIVAISHQPHLSAVAGQHLLVERSGPLSRVRALDENERIDEIARIIAGGHASQEARNLGVKLRSEFLREE